MTGEKCDSDVKQDSSDDGRDETCIFCKIANRDDPFTEILAEVSRFLSTCGFWLSGYLKAESGK